MFSIAETVITEIIILFVPFSYRHVLQKVIINKREINSGRKS